MTDARAKAAKILERIREENPTYWPYGLSVDQFDGGLYLVSKSASEEPIGFVGWQARDEGSKRIGYYSIGVLPEFRHHGFAKSAVTSILREKAATVDEVRAMVMAHNQPSKALARSLGVAVQEKAAAINRDALILAAKALAGGTGNAAFWDQANDPSRTPSSTLNPLTWDKGRAMQGGLNFGLGALGGGLISGAKPEHTLAGAGIMALTPVKDLAMKGNASLHKLDTVMAASMPALNTASSPAAGLLGKIPKEILLGALGLGVGGLGVAAYSAKRKADAAKEQADAARSGRVRVTLPTKDPNDAETLLDLPIEDISMSDALKLRLGRDTRRRLYAETKGRTRKRKPANPDAPTPAEQEMLAINKESEELDKAAAFGTLVALIRNPALKMAAAKQPAVPSPPIPGANPALRQQAQMQAAHSIDTSTAANPQIMKAQADAVSAEQAAQQQVAQAEQAQAQKEMDMQQKFQQQMAAADADKQRLEGEKQVMQMELEKARIHGELVSEKAKAEKEMLKQKESLVGSVGKAEGSVVDSITQSRLSRIAGRIKSAAATPQPPAPGKILRSDAMDQLNRNGFAYTASGAAPPINTARVSYGKPLDWLYSQFVRPILTQPPAAGIAAMSPAAQMAGPTPNGLLSMLSRYAGMNGTAELASQLNSL